MHTPVAILSSVPSMPAFSPWFITWCRYGIFHLWFHGRTLKILKLDFRFLDQGHCTWNYFSVVFPTVLINILSTHTLLDFAVS
jgi:hypothetical protein